jgi:tetratricopeptide (TPR) repeat protein
LGLQFYKKGDYAKASTYFEEALKKTQHDPLLWYYDALCFHQLKNWAMAKSRYKTTATYFPQTEAGKRAAAALKGIDPSFTLPQAASADTAADKTKSNNSTGMTASTSGAKSGNQSSSTTAKEAATEEEDSEELRSLWPKSLPHCQTQPISTSRKVRRGTWKLTSWSTVTQ